MSIEQLHDTNECETANDRVSMLLKAARPSSATQNDIAAIPEMRPTEAVAAACSRHGSSTQEQTLTMQPTHCGAHHVTQEALTLLDFQQQQHERNQKELQQRYNDALDNEKVVYQRTCDALKHQYQKNLKALNTAHVQCRSALQQYRANAQAAMPEASMARRETHVQGSSSIPAAMPATASAAVASTSSSLLIGACSPSRQSAQRETPWAGESNVSRTKFDEHHIYGIVKKLRTIDTRKWFCSPVDVQGLGLADYHHVVKTPMDLGTVITKYHEGAYAGNVYEMIRNVLLTFDNATLYNTAPNHAVSCEATRLKSYFLYHCPAARTLIPTNTPNNLDLADMNTDTSVFQHLHENSAVATIHVSAAATSAPLSASSASSSAFGIYRDPFQRTAPCSPHSRKRSSTSIADQEMCKGANSPTAHALKKQILDSHFFSVPKLNINVGAGAEQTAIQNGDEDAVLEDPSARNDNASIPSTSTSSVAADAVATAAAGEHSSPMAKVTSERPSYRVQFTNHSNSKCVVCHGVIATAVLRVKRTVCFFCFLFFAFCYVCASVSFC